MEAVDATPGRGDQKVDHAVAIDIAHADRVEPERVAGSPAGVGLQQRTIAARVEIRTSAGDRSAGVLPRADDEIVVTVAVDITGGGRADAETLAGGVAGQGQE